MSTPLKAASIWRIIRDVDLDGIRRAALERFEVWVTADWPDDAEAVRRLLGPAGDPHPWIRAITPETLAAPLAAQPLLAILVTREPEPSPALVAARNTLRAATVPVLVVVTGHASGTASVPRAGEDARVAVPELGPSAADVLAGAMLERFSDDRRIALARQLPLLRRPYFDAVIQETAQANASFALTTGLAETVPVLTAPLNVGDIVVLTKNQLMLGYRILLAAGRTGDARTLFMEIVGVLGSGLLFRQIARQLVGLIPVAGLVPKVAIAYSGTWAIGRAIALWATEGRAVTPETLRTLTAESLSRGREVAEGLVRAAGATAGRATNRLQRFRKHIPGRSR